MWNDSRSLHACTLRLASRSALAIVVIASLAACGRSEGPPASAFGTTEGQLLVRSKSIQWGNAPPSLPAGAKAAVLQGNPNEAVPYVMRLYLPAKYRIAFHSHTKPQDVTVMSGTLFVANSETFDKKKAFSVRPGDFYHLPALASQFVFTKADTVIEIHGVGPYDIRYANSGDDPLKGSTPPAYYFPLGFKINEIKSTDADEVIDMTY